MFRADLLLEEYRNFEAESAAAVVSAVEAAGNDIGFVTLDPEAFARATAKSIDYAVMERTARAAVIPVSYGWSDVGSWQSVWELSARDAANNAAQGSAVFVDARGSYVASDKQLVALFGVENLVVVVSDDAVLVARREDGEVCAGWYRSSRRPRRASPKNTSRCIVPGVPISRSIRATGSRSSASSSSRADGYRCRCTIIAPSIGSSCAARRG